jgi:hypothetical protein
MKTYAYLALAAAAAISSSASAWWGDQGQVAADTPLTPYFYAYPPSGPAPGRARTTDQPAEPAAVPAYVVGRPLPAFLPGFASWEKRVEAAEQRHEALKKMRDHRFGNREAHIKAMEARRDAMRRRTQNYHPYAASMRNPDEWRKSIEARRDALRKAIDERRKARFGAGIDNYRNRAFPHIEYRLEEYRKSAEQRRDTLRRRHRSSSTGRNR